MPRVLNMRGKWWDGDGYSPNKYAPNSVYVGRPSKWGNPYIVGVHGDRARCVQLFRDNLSEVVRKEAVAELRGKDLICWCAPKACHADVLLEIANDQT